MKLPDSEPLSADEYWVITDQWKQEWEKGVQVPVNPDSLPRASVTVVSQASSVRHHHDFKLLVWTFFYFNLFIFIILIVLIKYNSIFQAQIKIHQNYKK